MTETTANEQLPWSARQWKIGTIEGARPASRNNGVILHGSYADGSPLQNAVHVLVGATAGPTLYLQAAVHGDEINGVEVLRRVVTGLDPQEMRGVLIVVPVTNGPGFWQHQRRNPFDSEDMNRVWPGKPNGFASQQIVYNLYEQAVRYADYVIDLHTASSSTLLHVVYGPNDPASRKLAEVFGVEVLLEETLGEDVKAARFAGKLRNALTRQGVPAITPELGGTDVFEEENILLGLRGVINVMKHIGMLDGAIVPPDKPQITLLGSHLDKVRAQVGGIWRAEVKAGQRVKQGDVLGYIYSVATFAVTQTLLAPYDGFILGTTDRPIVNIGDGLTNICRV